MMRYFGFRRAENRDLNSSPRYVDVEAITNEKRDWEEQNKQQQQNHDKVAWPARLFELFAVVGLPPDQEITQIVEDLYEKDQQKEASSSSVGEASVHSPPWPAYPAQVIHKFPSTGGPDLSDQELSSLCFPHKVSPSKLKRTPSWSNLQEVIFEKQGAREQHGFVFMLKAGDGLPLYGVCVHTQEVLHRPPFIAAHIYPDCKGPFRQDLSFPRHLP